MLDDDFNNATIVYDQLGHASMDNWHIQNNVVMRHDGDVINGKTVHCDGGCIDLRPTPNRYSNMITATPFIFAAGDRLTLQMTFSFDQIGTIGESFAAVIEAPNGLLGLGQLTGDGINYGDWHDGALQLANDFDGNRGLMTTTWSWTALEAGSMLLSVGAIEALDNIDTSDSSGPLLDRIRLDISSPSAAGVPEPSSWGTAVLGFAVIGAAMRRRRPSKVARA